MYKLQTSFQRQRTEHGQIMPVSSGPEALNPQASVLAAALPRGDHDGGVTFRLKGEGFLLVPALVSGTVGRWCC